MTPLQVPTTVILQQQQLQRLAESKRDLSDFQTGNTNSELDLQLIDFYMIVNRS